MMHITRTVGCRGSGVKIAGLMTNKQLPIIHKPSSPTPSSTQLLRFMGGGPRNPEHTKRRHNKDMRKNRLKKEELKKLSPNRSKLAAKQKIVVDTTQKIRSASQSTKITTKPKNIGPLPEDIERYMPAIEKYVTTEWMPTFPEGASTNRLRRDIAFRMKKGGPSKKKKLPITVVDSIAWEIVERGECHLELWTKGKGQYKLAVKGALDDDEGEVDDDEGEVDDDDTDPMKEGDLVMVSN